MEGKQTKGGERNENQESFKNRGERGEWTSAGKRTLSKLQALLYLAGLRPCF